MDLSSFMAKQPKQTSVASPEAVKDFSDGRIPEGHRNNTMSRIAASLLKRYGDTQEAYEKYLEEAEKCDPPLPDSELKTIWDSARKLLTKIESEEGYIEPEVFNDPKLAPWLWAGGTKEVGTPKETEGDPGRYGRCAAIERRAYKGHADRKTFCFVYPETSILVPDTQRSP